MICFRGARPRNAMDGDQLEYGVYEQYEQDTCRSAFLRCRTSAITDIQPITIAWGLDGVLSHSGFCARRAKRYRVALRNISYRHFTGCIEHRISNRANMRVDALKVAQNVKMERCRF